MRSVWSFWTKPFLAERHTSWHSELHHWLAWGLSLHTAGLHYPDTQLVTDDAGARILIDELGLPFQSVSTALNALDAQDPGWWALGKLEAYRVQDRPFVHIDTDVFLWNALRYDVEMADVFAQNPEPITFGASCYCPDDLERSLGYPRRGWLPPEWSWYRRQAPLHARAECCGIFGGNRIEFIRHYAASALRVITDRKNLRGLSAFREKPAHMILIEQYLLTACLESHRDERASPFAGVEIRYVFESAADAYRRECATEAGYTHLAAGAKRDPTIALNLKNRVLYEIPEHFDACMAKMDRAKLTA
jgi:hypothetical protein